MVHAYAKSHEGRTIAELEATIPQWVPGCEQHAGVLLAIEWLQDAKRAAEAERSDQSFRASYEQKERHHTHQVAAARSHARRAEFVAWVAIAISLAALFLPHLWPERPAAIAASPIQSPALVATPTPAAPPPAPANSSAPTAIVAPPSSSLPATGTTTTTATPAPKQP